MFVLTAGISSLKHAGRSEITPAFLPIYTEIRNKAKLNQRMLSLESGPKTIY
jgi:hypothetical protein